MTIARFRVRHQQALADFLVQSLKLCAAAGLIQLYAARTSARLHPPMRQGRCWRILSHCPRNAIQPTD